MNSPAIAFACLAVFLSMAALMYARKISALLALPLMAVLIGIAGGIPGPDMTAQVLGAGPLKLHNAYTTTMFGAVLAELVNRQGIAKTLIRNVAEFAGDNPYVLGILLTSMTALLFSTLGGLGAVIMVGTIVLPVMLSLGIPTLTAGGLFLFGISMGGMFNLANWQLYTDVLDLERSQIISFVLPFSAIMAVIVLVYLAVQLRKPDNFAYLAGAAAALAGILYWLSGLSANPGAVADGGPAEISFPIVSASAGALCLYAIWRHRTSRSGPGALALATPFVPLCLVLAFHWEIIPSFCAGIAYGVLATWQRGSIVTLSRSIIDGIQAVIPAVVLMIGIGMLLSSVMHPRIAQAIEPFLRSIVPTRALPYVAVFTLIAPLALYRGPLSLWGMGSGLVALVVKTTQLSAQAIMGMLMSVGQIQGVCDPTNTHNIWIATYLGTDTQKLLASTIPYVWAAVFAGLVLAVSKGFVPL